LSSSSIATDGKGTRTASVELVSDFEAQSFVESPVRTPPVAAPQVRKLTRGPHILLATTGQLPSTARLAIELHDAGARVSLISPRKHPARVLHLMANQVIYRALSPKRSLECALLRLRPDLVVPCDELAVRDLHAICLKTKNPEVRRLIQRSTCPVENYPTVTSRAELLALARLNGARVPPSAALPDSQALDQWIAANPPPFVLKADGSWAGFGVRIVASADAAKEAFAQMTKPASGFLGIRESLLEGNHFSIQPWLRGERSTMSAQGYIDGWPANIGVACWQGEVLATIGAEAVATVSATGASSVIRLIHNDEMIETAKCLVSALRLSGFIGFDFMIEAATGAAWLIEMNPRNTPICALRLGGTRDLTEALVSRLAGRPKRDRPGRSDNDVVVFFPDSWLENGSSTLLDSAFHDVPWDYPDLVRVLMRPGRRDRYWVFRMLRRLWLALRAKSGDREF
jgi:hypothetical protein